MKALIKNKNQKYSKSILRIFLLIITSLSLIFIFNISKKIFIEELREGDIALRTIYLPGTTDRDSRAIALKDFIVRNRDRIKDLLKRTLTPNPEDRLSLEELLTQTAALV